MKKIAIILLPLIVFASCLLYKEYTMIDMQRPELSSESSEFEEMHIPGKSVFEINYIDIGQADCALIQCDGETMLIDGGNAADSRYPINKPTATKHSPIVIY